MRRAMPPTRYPQTSSGESRNSNLHGATVGLPEQIPRSSDAYLGAWRSRRRRGATSSKAHPSRCPALDVSFPLRAVPPPRTGNLDIYISATARPARRPCVHFHYLLEFIFRTRMHVHESPLEQHAPRSSVAPFMLARCKLLASGRARLSCFCAAAVSLEP